METELAGARLRAIGTTIIHLAGQLEAGEGIDPQTLDLAVAQLKGVRVRAFGVRRTQGASARDRLREHFIANVSQELPGEELAEIAGISEWARRVRELRSEGLHISQPRPGLYRLDEIP